MKDLLVKEAEENDEELVKPALDSKENKGKETKEEKQVDKIIGMASKFDFFKDDLDNHYVVVDHEGYFDILSLDSRRFKLLLIKTYRDKNKITPGDTAINNAIQVLGAEAEFSNKERKLQKRVAKFKDKYYYDLCNKAWDIIEIDNQGVRIAEDPPILFVRTKNMKEQDEPDFTVKPEELLMLISQHFSFKKEQDKILLAIYLVSSLIPDIGHPILVIHGEKGSGKSTSMRKIKSIVDPAIQDLLVFPQSNEDLAITLSNNYMPMFDNLDSLSAGKSDMLCQACTGGAFSKRKLYSDTEGDNTKFQEMYNIKWNQHRSDKGRFTR